MEYVTIPIEALESPDYLGLSPFEQKFLIDLYVIFRDAQCWTVDMTRPQDYRQSPGASLNRKVTSLLNAGLIQVVGTTGKPGNARRVFSFTHPAREALAEAA